MFGKPASTSKQPSAHPIPAPPAPARASRTPEREGLALAIARKDKGKRELATIENSQTAYVEKRLDCYKIRDDAEAAVASAKVAQAEYAATIAVGGTAPMPLTTRAARDALDDARDNLEIIVETEKRLAVAREEWEKSLRSCEQHVIDARAAIIRSDPTVQALFDRFLALQAELASAREILDFLGRFSAPGQPIIQAFMNDRTQLAEVSPWRTFYSGLLDDADAAPPSL